VTEIADSSWKFHTAVAVPVGVYLLATLSMPRTALTSPLVIPRWSFLICRDASLGPGFSAATKTIATPTSGIAANANQSSILRRRVMRLILPDLEKRVKQKPTEPPSGGFWNRKIAPEKDGTSVPVAWDFRVSATCKKTCEHRQPAIAALPGRRNGRR